MKHLRRALFMIFLVLSLPVVSAIQLNQVSVTGSDGIPFVIAEEDTVLFTILVDLDGQALTPGDIGSGDIVVIRGLEEHPVTDCIYANGSTSYVECSKELQIDTNHSSVYYFDIMLSDYYYSPRPMLFLDTEAPTFSDTTVSATQSGAQIDFTLSSRDQVNYGSNKCSGLGEAKLYIKEPTSSGYASHEIGSVPFNGTCQETISSSVNFTGEYDSTVSFCVKVWDVFGNVGDWDKCANLELDSKKPVVSDIALFGSNGAPLTAVFEDGMEAKLKFNVFDAKGVSEDLTKVSVNTVLVAVHVVGKDYSYNGTTLYFESDDFTIPSTTSDAFLDVQINGSDFSGNIQTENRGYTLSVDTDAPEFVKFDAPYNNLGCWMVDEGDFFNVHFYDSGIGMTSADAYLYNFPGMSGDVKQAKQCNLVSNEWVCEFGPVLTVPEGEYLVSLHGSTSDDFGNIAQTNASAKVCVDRTAPIITDVYHAGESGIGRINNVVSENQQISVDIHYYDVTPVTAVVNFSMFNMPDGVYDPNYNVIEKVCTSSPCTVKSKNIGFAQINDAVITLEDALGSKSDPYLETIKVRYLKEDVTPLIVKTSYSPEALDREISEQTTQKQFVSVSFTSDNPGFSVVEAEYMNCVNPPSLTDKQVGIDYIIDDGYVGSNADQTEHFLLMTTKDAPIFFDTINLNCKFKVVAFDDDNLYPSIEELVPVSIKFFNDPVDMPDVELQNEIDSAYEDTQGMWEALDEMYTYVQMLEKICSIYTTIRGIITAVATIMGILALAETTLDASVYGKSGAEAILHGAEIPGCLTNQATTKGADTAEIGFISRFCAFISCEISAFDYAGDLDGKGTEDSGSTYRDQESGNTQQSGDSENAFDYIGGDDDESDTFWNMGNSDTGQDVFDAHGYSYSNQESIFHHLVNLCLPGLLKKAHEWRAIKCEYVNCLLRTADNDVLTTETCESIEANSECRYIFGEVFSLIPFTAILEEFMGMVKQMIIDPTFAVAQVADWSCTALCKSKYAGIVNNACGFVFKTINFSNALARLYKIYENYETYFDFEEVDSYCDIMDENIDAYKLRKTTFDTKIDTYKPVATTSNTSGGSS